MIAISVLMLLATMPGWSGDVLDGKGKELANAFLKRRIEEMSDVPTPPSLEAMKQIQIKRHKELMRMLGLDPMPPRTPLHARITGTLQRDGYRIEKVVFDSRPRFYVTAHVYVPEPANRAQQEKFPVIVNVNGHWAHKKDEDRVQLRCAFQALRGFLAIAVDSPGFSFEGNSLIERRAEGDHNDWALVEGGTNATGYYVWDTIRALDYIATRHDTDMARVGLTGASGGGLATLYAFAADSRYKAAVPVVYMSSLQQAPDNGCLCNHVPGTSQIGDRSDVIAIQAPKPVLLMGAERDGEFPPGPMRLTREKMAKSWALFGKGDDVSVKIFPGGHDYNQGMRESMIGFFERYLLNKGDGTPVPEPAIKLFDPEDRQLLALDPPAKDERTMRDLAREALRNAPKEVSAEQAIAANGGLPARTPLNLKLKDMGDGVSALTYESEPGLVTPAIERTPSVMVQVQTTIWLDDAGMAASMADARPPGPVETQVFLDTLGTGELAGVELRYLWYAGRSAPFVGGWQVARLVEALKLGLAIEIKARGPVSSQTAMWAALMCPAIKKVTATDCLKDWSDVYENGVTEYAVQPRANLCGSLAHLRSLVKNSTWSLRKGD